MSAPAPRTIFLSYRWRGAEDVAAVLTTALRARLSDVEVFQDSASLSGGDSWPAELRSALERASAMLVLIDPDWLRHDDDYGRRRLDLQSDWVRLELERAFARRIPVIPVLLDDARLPPAEALPPSLRPLSERRALRLRRERPEQDVDALVKALQNALTGQPERPSPHGLPFQLLSLELQDFRGFERLQIDLAAPSTLPGEWTCIAGVNGAGKSTILQAIALLLMGPDRARELGGRRLDSLRRRDVSGDAKRALLRARVRHLDQESVLEMSIDESGPRAQQLEFWSYSPGILVAGYGASRNLSDIPDLATDLSDTVRASASLFHSMSRLQFAEAMLHPEKRAKSFDSGSALLQELVSRVFGDELEMRGDASRPRFLLGDAGVGALELPDGFRSSLAWMADLCARWARLRLPREAANVAERVETVSEMTGVVLIDELDLHLHPSLQRAIVPRLRMALPKVQFVVTSHSPLVLASFDRDELIPLDISAEDGVRELDRQILGFSPNQVYEWLLGTPASSEAAEQAIASATSPDRRTQVAEMLLSDPETSPEQAKARLARIRERIGKLKP